MEDIVYFTIRNAVNETASWQFENKMLKLLKPGSIYMAEGRRLDSSLPCVIVLSNADVLVRTKGNLRKIVDLREDKCLMRSNALKFFKWLKKRI